MTLEVKHIGGSGNKPAYSIGLIVKGETGTLTEDITNYRTDKVDENFIQSLLDIAKELGEHNDKVDNYYNKNLLI